MQPISWDSHWEKVTWNHATGVSQSVLLADIVADQPLVCSIIEGSPQIAWGEHFSFPNLSCLLDMQPLAVVLEQELMAAWETLDSYAVDGAWAVNSHTRSSLQSKQYQFAKWMTQ